MFLVLTAFCVFVAERSHPMAAFLASVLSLIFPAIRNHIFSRAASHSFGGIPLPASPHVVVPPQTIALFDEVVVIGDVHGCFDELIHLLDKIHHPDSPSVPVEEKKILKVFVGDLVNKGPKSREVIQFLLQDHCKDTCISVRGNHDDVVVDQVLNVVRKDRDKLRPKNMWMQEVTEEELRFLMDLPYSISIPSLHALIVHAGVVPGVSVQDMSPGDLVSMRNVVKTEDGFTASRSHAEATAWAKCWSGPTHVYFGHDAKRLLQREAHATGLDTGCVYGKNLTGVFIKGPRKGQFISVTAKEVYQKVTNGD